MSVSRILLPFAIASWLAGCGTYVPEIQEFPGGPADGQLLVQDIVQSVHCEVANAVSEVINADILLAKQKNHGFRSIGWLDTWGAQLTLTLTVVEKSAFSPNGAYVPASPITSLFTLAGAAGLTSEATRTDTLNYFYSVADLTRAAPCSFHSGGPPNSLLVQSDLKLREWLFSQLMSFGTGVVDYPTNPAGSFKQNVLSHEVKFVVSTSGSLNPAWTLVRGTINQSGSLLSANRDRTHDLLITFGPIDKDATKGLASAAAETHFAKQVGLAVATNLRPAQ
jgi:hypothetical protein